MNERTGNPTTNHRNWVGMTELSYIPETEIVVLYFPAKIDHVAFTMDQIDSLASILRDYVKDYHKGRGIQ